MKNYHVLVIAYPGQGHVIPLMDVARCLTSNGLKVTFVNTEAIYKRLMCAWSEIDDTNDLMQMVSIPDGMLPRDDRDDMAKLFQTMSQLMPSKLEKLIEDINKSNNEKITCIVADYCMGWVTRVAKKMSIRQATFCSGSAALLTLIMSVQKLLDDQVIDSDGVPLKYQMVQLSKSMPLMDPAKFTWECIGDSKANKIMFDHAILEGKEAAEAADRIICNSAMELEPGAFALFPVGIILAMMNETQILPIGPLLASNKFRKQAGHFWNEDATCLEWLDQQPVSSVIYVAFGSYTIFDKNQFEELALGLELTNKPFLWVVRLGTSGSTEYVYSSGYVERVGTRGKMVSWAPQQDVLNHPSVGCFISHCGWNSTMEGVSNGVPFLCWPYFADQFLNTSYICDIWKTGLGLNKDDNGIVTRLEIKRKVEELFSNDIVKQNALHVKEKTMDSVREGNSSDKNLSDFIDWVKKGNENAPASEN